LPAALTAALTVATLVALPPGGPAFASTTDAAFNSSTGMLNVNYASYLSKHDIVSNRPNTNPLFGMTVGNGKTGAMVWNQNQLMMQVSGVDLSQQSAFGAGNVNLQTTPAMDSGYSTFQQRLSLYDGTLTTKIRLQRYGELPGDCRQQVRGGRERDRAVGAVRPDRPLARRSRANESRRSSSTTRP